MMSFYDTLKSLVDKVFFPRRARKGQETHAGCPRIRRRKTKTPSPFFKKYFLWNVKREKRERENKEKKKKDRLEGEKD